MSDKRLTLSVTATIVRVKLISFSLFLNGLIMVANSTMFTVAIPTIAQGYKISPSMAAWMVTSYSVFFAIGTLLYGRLTVFYSIPTLISIGLGLLGIGSVLGIITDSYLLLVLARVVQAMGMSSISALGIVIVSSYFPKESRGKALATIASASVLGFGLGPLVGGLVSDYLGWRYLFVISFVGLLTLPIYRRFIPNTKPVNGQFDGVGFVLFSMAFISLMLTVSSGKLWFLQGLICFPLFLIHIKKKKEPFLPLSLLRDDIYQKALCLAFFIFFIHFSILFITPLLLVNIHEVATSLIGWILFFGALASSFLMKLIGKYVDSIGVLSIIGLSMVCMIIATFLYSGLSSYNAFFITIFFFISSTGFSCITLGMSSFMTQYMPHEKLTAGYGAMQLIQFFGGAFGVAVAGNMLDSEIVSHKAWNPLWPGGGQIYSNSYFILCIVAWLAFAVYIRFYVKAKRVSSIQIESSNQ
jgi:MFS transporter, DHA2 family, metal-tetracycline-proton antiporter